MALPSRALRSALGAALVATFVGACRSDDSAPQSGAAQVQIGAVRWYVDYDAALEVAREQDKALWVHFGENPG